MSDEKLSQYLKGRYAEILAYYDKRAIQNKRAYQLMSWYIIAVSGFLAPMMAIKSFKESLWPPFLTTSVAVIAALLGHSKFHETWLRYRGTWDRLKREPELHAAGIGPYQGATDPNALLVSQVESLIAGEGKEWLSNQVSNSETRGAKPASGA